MSAFEWYSIKNEKSEIEPLRYICVLTSGICFFCRYYAIQMRKNISEI